MAIVLQLFVRGLNYFRMCFLNDFVPSYLDADTVSKSEFLSDSDSYSEYDSDEYDSDTYSETCSYVDDSAYDSDTGNFQCQIFSTRNYYQCEYGTRYKSCDCGCRYKP